MRAQPAKGRFRAATVFTAVAALWSRAAEAQPSLATGGFGGAPTLKTTLIALVAAAVIGTAAFMATLFVARRRAAAATMARTTTDVAPAPRRTGTVGVASTVPNSIGAMRAVLLLLGLGAILLVVTVLVYQASVQSAISDTRRLLGTLAEVQVRNLAQERQRLETGALALGSSRFLADDVAGWHAEPSSERRERLRLLLGESARAFGFTGAELWANNGAFILSSGPEPGRPDMAEMVREVAATGQMAEAPPPRDTTRTGGFAFLVNVPVRGAEHDPCCVLFLQSAVRPEAHPMLSAVFRTARSAEALLVAPDPRGGVRVASAVSRDQAAPLPRTFVADPYPFAAGTDSPGATGAGADPSGRAVLAVRAPIPGDQSSLVLKVDRDEVLGGARTSAFFSAALACVLLLLAVAVGRGLLQKSRMREAARELSAARAVGEAEARFRAAFDQAATGILHLDLDGTILRANGKACRMLGRPASALIGERMWHLREPDPASGGADVIGPLLDGRSAEIETEESLVRPDGSAVWLAFTFSLVRNADGAADHLLLVAQDISARRAAEAALRESEERFGLAVKGSDQGVWDLNIRTGSLYLSQRAREMLGVGADEAVDIRRPWHELLHPDDRRKVAAAWKAFLRGGAPTLELDIRLRRPDGSYHDFRWHGLAARDAAGALSRAVGLLADITRSKHTERHLRLAAAVFANSYDGLVVTNLKSEVSAVNPAFSRITGYSEEEILGQNMRLLHSGRHDRDFYRSLWSELTTAGSWQGEIWNRRKNGEIFLQQLNITTVYDDSGAAQNFVGAFQDITQAKHSEFELDRIAHYDPLTDLPNRTLLASLLDLALSRPGSRCAVLFVDLDRFKTVNDSLGHMAGDAVLQMAARRIQDELEAGATLGRHGGDEFVIILEGISGPEDAATLANHVIQEMGRPFSMPEGGEIYLGASVGISLFPEDAETPASLLQHADSALAEAKSHGRGGYAFYTQALTRGARVRMEMEADLRRALARDEFILNFQPVVNLATGRITGTEALVRWQSPTHGLVTPNRFIPLAEETGLIEPLGNWVMEAACRQMAEWLDKGADLDFIAVNLSPRQFQRGALCEFVDDVLRRTGLPAHKLEVEITESLLFDARAAAERKLRQLKDTGVRIALDDFGTGYSSLAYLKRFPISKLKIDRSFVRDLPRAADAEIATAIISIARALGFSVVAEGIEDPRQHDFLKARGCDFGQGHLFSRAVTGDRLLRLALSGPLAPGPAPGAPRGAGPISSTSLH
ncbi:bifunctional diguanylate cyclase/phosphodiesterase [Xanthobacter aminoxidans]|uniref:bifunctional diguanylate cyclase/phosphodiesterase n=1 Tax=Xanthobacter aminoxidans TaxID=186280 RepID=UPI002022E8EF|nr:bifunctional diguanylate cyclase/phosphodiesterase [Xanthobacter aminoxidans]MCL8381734.1 EAL domain-containing protein [Xanthobacter aminoxidans]